MELMEKSRGARIGIWVAAAVIGSLGLLGLGLQLAEGPLARFIVERINGSLDGYTVRLAGLDLHLLGASVTLHDFALSQDAIPTPEVVVMPRLDVSLDAGALFAGAVVLSARVERPVLNVSLAQLRKEAGDGRPVSEKGWQDAFHAVSPLEINRVNVVDGAATYQEEAGAEPIELEAIELLARNIRNVRSEPGSHPSPIHLDARVFREGTLVVDGAADFLATPHPTGLVRFELSDVPLVRIDPASKLVGVKVRAGRVKAMGELESEADVTSVRLEELRLDAVEADYVETKAPKTPEKKAVKQAAKTAAKSATKTASESRVAVAIASFEVEKSRIGFVDASVDPAYRLFVDVESLSLRDFDNAPTRAGDAAADRESHFSLVGRVMGSGSLKIGGDVRPARDGPDLDVEIQLRDMEVAKLNDLLRAHGRFDVAAGRLSVFSEVDLHARRVDGYVKPIFVDLEISNPAQDRGKPILDRLYEGTIGAVAKLLENDQVEQVATITPIRGRLDAIDADGWRTFVLLLRNAFVEAIRGGLEAGGPNAASASGSSRRPDRRG